MPFHMLHWYGLSPVWILKCLLRRILLIKALLHWLHWYLLSPVCIFICLLRVSCIENALLNCLHWYGLSSVCVIMCLLRWLLVVNALLHSLHLKAFSPLWFLMCFFKNTITFKYLIRFSIVIWCFSCVTSSYLIKLHNLCHIHPLMHTSAWKSPDLNVSHLLDL